MDATLLADVLERLDGDETVLPEVAHLVLAALIEELDLALDGRASTRPAPAPRRTETPLRAYVKSVGVEGFRGVGPRATLELPPGPGLTLVVGRNGSGKSSFAEALELALTGRNPRWDAKRARLWREGWRNLHHPVATIESELLIDGQPGASVLRRAWGPEADLDDARTVVRHNGADEPLASLGWEQAIGAYRPFLSYSELGGMLEDGPAKLFDALASILGLEDLTAAAKRLADARLALAAEHKRVEQELKAIREALLRFDDERATRCALAFGGKSWDLDAVAAVLGDASMGSGEESPLRALRELADLTTPSPEAAAAKARALGEALVRRAATVETDAGRAHTLAAVLEGALHLHAEHDASECPVCRSPGRLDATWAEGAKREIERLRELAHDATEAHQAVVAATRTARTLVMPVPVVLDAAAALGIDSTPLSVAWSRLAALTTVDGPELAARLEDAVTALAEAATEVCAAAREELGRREDAWRPVADVLRHWLPRARRMQEQVDLVESLGEAEHWIKATDGAIRNERFAPIAASVKHNWSLLRASSSVELDKIQFEGAATRRRVSLDVTVDGQSGAALGVMSQGELHALALSLFLPRATLDVSPFGFIVIDDPVQAMDPARVDGLARVLESVSGDRQVIVFTHDDRLPAAVRRLRIPATLIEVQRRANSQVQLRRRRGPVQDSIEDALALAFTDDLPVEVAARVIPGLCRQALESAAIEVFRRRRLARGEPHAAVETLLVDRTRLLERLALALFDDAAQAGNVMRTLNNKRGKRAGDVVLGCNSGAHGQFLDDPLQFTRDAEELALWLQEAT